MARQLLSGSGTLFSDTLVTPYTLVERDLNGDIAVRYAALSRLLNSGASRGALRTITGTASATVNDRVIICNGASFTLTLPAAADAFASDMGMFLWIFNKHATGVPTVDGASAETINGAANFTLATQYTKALLIPDGVEWWRLV